MRESELMRAIHLRASKLGWRIFRNNCGLAKIGDRYIKYGVCNPGGSDLIGWRPAIIDGKSVAQFVAIECKIKTPLTKEQANFLKQVIKAGGIGLVAHSVEEFDKLIKE